MQAIVVCILLWKKHNNSLAPAESAPEIGAEIGGKSGRFPVGGKPFSTQQQAWKTESGNREIGPNHVYAEIGKSGGRLTVGGWAGRDG